MEVDEMETRMPQVQESRERVENRRKTQSDGERDDDDNMSGSPCESVPSTNETPSKKTHLEEGSDFLSITKKAVVVLTRLPEYKISALRPPTPQQFYSEDESPSSSDSDMQWEPEAENSSLDLYDVSEPAPVIISSAFSYCSDETTKIRPNLPEEEVKVDMMVLAKRRPMRWQRGKIVEIVTREDGRLKYKVSFEDKGKSLVSGHHIAFDTTPKLEQLYVGARVVVGCQEDKLRFQSGILAELPTRKNRLRFLVFLDDHMPVYVGLPLLHLVCRPLEECLDDIPDSRHKSFMNQYLKDWPYPHLTQYKAGQSLNAELNGVQQRCEVQVVDSSLIQVVFQENQHKEWIHRGSIRLEHMARFLELKGVEEQSDDSD
ncbi:histone-lysine N-methyltransferase SETDB1-B-like isoform X1 [Chelmon rostratus]|uniref:histone-lysine N-methyltransferase SETDB1-B-like isoform X1 n=2 Tax=Chelmon rostratus TaxID=109905 RepID=UPI001BEC07A9|nr:histone-lysine N-methyltransferase SETDB1-B-like isoform X1 [Chelmon rostratus]XP_041811973.1 histone-lysine N-methyltransferase SETDB1-B-like isoform X1 [Chelmon rostratus]